MLVQKQAVSLATTLVVVLAVIMLLCGWITLNVSKIAGPAYRTGLSFIVAAPEIASKVPDSQTLKWNWMTFIINYYSYLQIIEYNCSSSSTIVR